MSTNPKSNTQETTEGVLVSRKQVCARWTCCTMTLKRREAEGVLKPVRFNSRMLRYRLSDILAIEAAAGGSVK